MTPTVRAVRRRSKGFILPATLGVLAVIALIATYFHEYVGRLRETASLRQESALAMNGIMDARAVVLYRMATEGFGRFGIGFYPPQALALDGRPYRTEDGTIVELQDMRGLLSINAVDQPVMERLLSRLGVPLAEQGPMLDKLRDYTDVDDLKRLNGAEKREYLDADLPPPPNDWLRTPLQMRHVLGWRERADLWRDGRLGDLLTVQVHNGYNPNTMPPDVLAALIPMSPEVFAKVLKLRQQTPYLSGPTLLNAAGIVSPGLEEVLVPFPSDTLRILLHGPGGTGGGIAFEYNVTLTPGGESGPWRINYALRSASPPVAGAPEKMPDIFNSLTDARTETPL